MINFDSVYQLSPSDEKRAISLDFYSNSKILYMDIMRGYNLPVNRFDFVIKSGREFADIMYAGWPGLFIISERFHAVFKDFDKIILSPVSIFTKNFNRINEKFFLLSTKGRCGKIDSTLSQSVIQNVGLTTRSVKMGLYFDLSSWDNSDFFVPDSTSYIFITERVKFLIEINNLTNFCIRSIKLIQNYSL